MKQETVVRAVLSGIIDRYVVEIAADPERSSRKLVDMAERVAEGHFQKIIYQMMQEMSRNRQSPYYAMLQHLATHTDKEQIKTVGIDLGYNAWTLGARNIRALEEQNGEQIPWVGVISRSDLPGRIPVSEMEKMITLGREKEIYAWILRYKKKIDEWAQVFEVIRAYPECVFGILCDPDYLTDTIIDETCELNNLFMILNTDNERWQEAADAFAQRRRTFGVFRLYENRDDAEDILNGSWLEEVSAYFPLLALSVAGQSCTEETAAGVADYMRACRLNQTYPVMPTDIITDSLTINNIISGTPVLNAVGHDGVIYHGEKHLLKPGPVGF